jgi:hypothetical protein
MSAGSGITQSQSSGGGGGGGGSPSEVWLQDANGFGSTGLSTRTYGTVAKNVGSDITYTSSATAGDSFTINTTGTYNISMVERTTSVASTPSVAISLNSSDTVSDPSLGLFFTPLEILTGIFLPVTDRSFSMSRSANLTAGDIIRVQMDVTGVTWSNGDPFNGSFSIVKV